jgi:hypothetical protein
MIGRAATDTIKGYFYQFDYSIEQLLNLTNDTDEITIEGIEDLDIESLTETTAVQCKYYSKTEYNHSVISKPIRLMLSHYKGVKSGIKPRIKYHLYGFYSSGQSKLLLPVNVNFLKDKFLCHKEGGIQKKHHEKLGLNDKDLETFLSLLSININAKEYLEQNGNIITSLQRIFNCDNFVAEYYYYNNALNEIRKIAIEDNINNRRITKSEFLDRINQKHILFNKWFLELKGKRQYHKELKNKYFRILNQSPFERFFLIDVSSDCPIAKLKELVFIISKHYSNLKKREPKNYCPYIYFNNLYAASLLELKQQLYDEGFQFIDGFPFFGSNFLEKHISLKADNYNNIAVKFIDHISQINKVLSYITKTREVYQFYFEQPFFSTSDTNIKNVSIQINNVENIKEII